jgi:hypothetical protein
MVPAATGTIARGGLAGQVCAPAPMGESERVNADTKINRDGFMNVLHCNGSAADNDHCGAYASNT